MTTHILNGFTLNRDTNQIDDPVTSFAPVSLTMVVPDGQTTFSYQIDSTAPDELPYVEVDLGAALPAINSLTPGAAEVFGNTFDASIGQITWNGNTSQVMTIEVRNGSTLTEHVFLLGGAAIPTFSTLSQVNAFLGSITAAGPIQSGPLAPGQSISFAGLPNTVTRADNEINGTSGNDTLIGTPGNDVINPMTNDIFDRVEGSTGNDTIIFSDIVPGAYDFSEIIYDGLNAGITVNFDVDTGVSMVDKGANGTDNLIDALFAMNWNFGDGIWIDGTDHNDTYNLNTGRDTWFGTRGDAGVDTYNVATNGIVRLSFSHGNQAVGVNLASGVVSNDGHGNTEQINWLGGSGRLEIEGSDFADSIIGTDRDERFILRQGNDTLDAGGGWDVLRYDRSGAEAVTVNLATGVATGTWSGQAFTHMFSGVEEVRGSREANDQITGDANDNYLYGSGGNDTLNGGVGEDTLEGGAGNDRMFGGMDGDFLRGWDGDDFINPGDNDDGYDHIVPGTGNDTVNFVDMTGGRGSGGIEHWDLSNGITATVNGNTNSGMIDKGPDGTTTILNVANAMMWGFSLVGTSSNDTFNVTVADDGWTGIRGDQGIDSYNIGAHNGTIRLDFRDYSGAATGTTVNLATRQVIDDGFGNAEVITGPGRISELRTSMQDDHVTGSANDDRFILMAGNDTLDGGAGVDLLRYDRSGVEEVTVNMQTGTATGVWDGQNFTHTFTNIEEVRGARNGNSMLIGDANANRLEGRDGNDTLRGADGNDTLSDGSGNDSVFGGNGDDLFIQNTQFIEYDNGDDTFDGGAGNDTVLIEDDSNYAPGSFVWEVNFLTGKMAILGSEQNIDTITQVENVIVTGAQGAVLTGDAANNRFEVSASASTLLGNFGNDHLISAAGDDILNGGAGFDTMDAGLGNDTVTGGDGRDMAVLGAGNDIFFDNGQGGVNGQDTVFGNQGNDIIQGGNGNDVFDGGIDNDLIFGRLGFDTLYGGDGFDTLDAGNGNDEVHGGNGRDRVILGAGNDIFLDNGQGGVNGQDTVFGNQGNDTIQGGNGNDVFDGGIHNDLIFGRLGFDTLIGGDGFDTLNAGDGNDNVAGGNGRDLAFLGRGNDIYFDNGQGGTLGQDTVFAGAGDDTIQGGNGNDVFRGEDGNDLIFGRLGDDLMVGGAGNDTMDGGAGVDTFVFGANFGTDAVNGYATGTDMLQFDDALWSGTLSTQQVVDQFANVQGGNVVFDFGADAVTLNGVGSLTGLAGDLIIV